jgi:hypothetical protein
MTNPTTKDDINDAADDVAKVADALHDMLMGEREVVIEFWMVDILMSAHGVLWGLADERESLSAENVKLRALVEEIDGLRKIEAEARWMRDRFNERGIGEAIPALNEAFREYDAAKLRNKTNEG